MPSWKKVAVSGSDASFNSVYAATNVTAQSFTGSLQGTASYAVSASYALSASYAPSSNSSSYAISASYALSSSYALSASYALTSSDAIQAQTASYVLNAISASYALSSSYTISSSYAVSSTSASYALSSSYAVSSSYSNNSTSASYALSSSYAVSATTASFATNFTASNILVAGTITAQTLNVQTITSSQEYSSGSNVFGNQLTNTQQFTGSVSITGSLAVSLTNQSEPYIVSYNATTGQLYYQGTGSFTANSASYAISASYAVSSTSASYALSSSYATSASYANNSTSASYALSSSYGLSASYAVSSSYATSALTASDALQAQTASYVLQAVSSSYALTASYLSGYVSPFPFTGSAVVSGSLAITGSLLISGSTTQVGNNTLVGNTVLSGSFNVTGSETFIGTQTLTGSLNISGSQTFVGNQTVTGSLTISGSTGNTPTEFTVYGDTVLSGSINISGSTVQTGNNNLFGSTTLSGSIIISGSLNPTTPTIKVYGNMEQVGYQRFDAVSTNIDTTVSASYIYVSGSTSDLYFAQNNNGYANTTRLRWIEGNLYTGLLNGGVMATQSSTVYVVGSGSGIIVNLNASLADNPYPTTQYVTWPNLTGSINAFTSSAQQLFAGIQSNGTIYAQSTPFTDGQFNTLIPVGDVFFANQTSINGVKTAPSLGYGWKQRSDVFVQAFGPLKLSGLTLAPSGSSTGSLVVGSGTAFADGQNYLVDPNNPSYIVDSGTNVSKINYYYQSGSNYWVQLTNGNTGYQSIDPTKYNNNGTLTAVPGGPAAQWSIQRVFWFPNSVTKTIVVYYGNATYTSEANALANIPFEPFVEAPNTAANAVYLGAIVIQSTGTFTNAATYTIYPGGLFRQVGGSGGGGSTVTTTLAGLSDVSISGQTNGQPLVWSTTANKWVNSSTLTATLTGNADTATTASYITGSIFTDGNSAASASYSVTSSYALTALTASDALQAQTASYVQNAQTASYVLNAVSASYAATASHSDLFTIGGSQMAYSNVPSTSAGNNGIFATNTGSFIGAFYQYTITSGSNARSENATAVWTNVTSSYSNYSTIDIGSTSAVVSSVLIVGGQVQLNILTPTAGWTVRATVTYV